MTAAPSGWRDGLLAWRNRLLSDARFQRWAADFPLTRPIARRRAAALFDLVAAFVYSQALSACVRLGLLERLRDGPLTAAQAAAAVGLPLEAAERLLKAASALKLVEPMREGRYVLGAQGAALIGNPGLTEMIAHHERLYADLADPVARLKGCGERGALADYWPYATSGAPREAGADAVAGYSALMAATMPAVAADLLSAYPIGRRRVLLDVGGGEGAFLAAAGAAAPGLKLRLFDLPAVTDRARDRLTRAGLMGRVEIFGGDFLRDALPKGADVITLVRIVHDQDDAGAAALLRRAREALGPDGVLLIAEPMSGGGASDRVADVYFAFYLLAMGRGRARSADELFAMLRTAGFSRTRLLRTRTPLLLRVIAARP